jgi:thiamine-phosphate pyrophosphorylase
VGADLQAARFYAILDSGYVPSERWVQTARGLLHGGADLVQLRAKQETPEQRRRLLEAILPLFRPGAVVATPPPLVINDDLQLALAAPGLGLHVGQEDMPAPEARRALGPDRILGLSTHSLAQAQHAITLGPAILSYFAVGPVFPTGTKPDYTPVGLGLVREVAALAPTLPFFCIGGITRANLAEVRAAGARRVVAVSDVLLAPDPAAAVREFRAGL